MSCNRWAIVYADGRVEVKHEEMTYDAISAAVEGYLEAAPTDGSLTIYCNEEGKLDGLPFNRLATAFAGKWLGNDALVGNVVVAGPPDDEGEDTSLPVKYERRLVQMSEVFA